ncbi:MAG: ABC transporter substrate-binding protein [Deltaproteobacteria bacterium]|nr:MAG: ABC transporter substrate-binding protein [Deltaproteobacteria bacterium]
MNRNLLWLLTIFLLASVHLAWAQQPGKVPRIGILPPGPISERVHLWEAFRQGLRKLGYVEGQNIILVFPSGEVKPERLPHLAAELVSLKVDVIVAAAIVAVQAAKEATKTIPIVMPVASDAVETGLVASLARPGGNITGLTLISSQLSGKRLELLKEVVPRLSRLAVLSNPTSAAVPPQMRETEVTARALGVQLQPLEVRGPDDFERVFQAATKERAGALITLDDALLFTQRTRIVKLAAKSRLPAIYGFREFVDAGGLMSYAANTSDMYRRAAAFVDKILKGAKPADLPVEQPTKFEFVINLKAAKQIGLTIPPNVLTRGDKVIK